MVVSRFSKKKEQKLYSWLHGQRAQPLTVQFLKPQKVLVRIGMIESICFVFWKHLVQNID